MSDLAWMRAVVERIEAARRDAAPEQPPAGTARHVVFRAGPAWYALPLDAVREVVLPRPPLVRVPGAPPAVSGAMNLRGRVVAVVDLTALLDAGPGRGEVEDGGAQQHVVLLDRGQGGVGLLVGAVVGVEALPVPATAGARPARSERLGADVVLLDPDAVEARAAALFEVH